MTWRLRRASVADLEAIMQLETRIFVNDAWSTESMRAELASKHAYYLVAERLDSPDTVDGYAGLLAPRGAQEGDIQTIAVTENARRSGLGRSLMQALLTEARKRGAHEVFLEVRADNPGAQNLYETLGFEGIAVRAGYYQPDDVDAIVMRLRLPEPQLRPAVGA